MPSETPAIAPRRASSHRRDLILPLGLILATMAVGTVGFWAVNTDPAVTLFDCFYFTVITVGTVGYGETIPLDTAGRVLAIFLIFMSVVVVGYAVTTIARFVVEGELDTLIRGRKMDKRIAQLSDHVILCGAGSTGACIAEEFIKTGQPFVAVERNHVNLEHLLRHADFLYLEGDATEDEVLQGAGIERARGIIAALPDDKDNLYIVLTARSINPRLRIVARLIHEVNAKKLRKAGADELVSPNAIGGLRLASVMIRPTVVGFLDTMMRHAGPAVRVEETVVGASSELAGRTLAEAQVPARTGMLVLALKPREGSYQFNPRASARLGSGDTLIVMGSSEQLQKLKALAGA